METIQIVIATATLLLVVATLFLVWVEVKQSKAAKEGLRFQQSGLRRQVLEAMLGFIENIGQQTRVSTEDLARYQRDIKWGQFIFDERRRDLLDEVYRKANELQFFTQQRENATTDEEFNKYHEKEHELLRWFGSGRRSKMEEEFRDYLEFK